MILTAILMIFTGGAGLVASVGAKARQVIHLKKLGTLFLELAEGLKKVPKQHSFSLRKIKEKEDRAEKKAASKPPKSETKEGNDGTMLDERVAPDKVRYVDMPNDLAADSKGVYGYLPTKESQFHSSKWPLDWSDAEQVEKARNTRLDYHVGLNKKQQFVDTLRRDGASDDDIAKQIVVMRNQDRLSHYKTPEALEVVYQRNLTKYGNKSGPTYESQLSKYGSSAEVINAALRSNNTMDILTGISKPKGSL